MLVSCSGVFEAKGHDPIEVVGIVRDEGGLMHICCGYGNLVIT